MRGLFSAMDADGCRQSMDWSHSRWELDGRDGGHLEMGWIEENGKRRLLDGSKEDLFGMKR